jgi:hypothetical protein
MAVQTTYTANISAARAGMIANTESRLNTVSRNVETAAGIGFGLPVDQGTGDNGIVLCSSGTTDPVGFTVRDRSVDPANPNEYSQYEIARVMTHGVIWVTVTDAGGVAAGDDVWLTKATGALSNADVGSDGGLLLAGCRWVSSAANGALAKISVNMDVPAVAGAGA